MFRNNLAQICTAVTALAFYLVCTSPSYAQAAQASVNITNGSLAATAGPLPGDDLKRIEIYDSLHNRYTDFPAGYSLLYPNSWQVDVSLSAIRTVLFNESTKIEIYYDNFVHTPTSASDYIHYGNHFITNRQDHVLESEETFFIDGLQCHFLQWSRRKLAHVENDKNYYASAEFIKNDHEVYTIFIKSAQPLTDILELITSFQLVQQQGVANIYRPKTNITPHLNRETNDFYQKYFNKNASLVWGVFEPSAPEIPHYLEALEEKMNYSFDFLLRYHTLEERLPVYGLTKAYERNKYVELTMQTILPGVADALKRDNSQDNNASIVYEILDGKYDTYLNEYALQLKDFGHPVLFRLNNEMNGDWCWYSAYYTGKDTDVYIALWKYIHQVFRANGVDNVLWVWNPHDVSRPNFQWNHHLLYYPGDEYVDIIGMTGYNTGTYFPGEIWREFDDIYTPLYAEYSREFTQPFMLTEFASNSVGGDKAAWIQHMFNTIGQFKNIKIAIWWSGVDYDRNNQPGRIYLIDEDEGVVSSFHNNLQHYKH